MSTIFFSFRLLLLNKLLEDGNTLFKKDKIGEAAHRYQYALRRLPNVLGNLANKSSTKATFEQLNVHLLLNLSRCKRKTGHFEEACDLANKVLHIQPTNFEAFYAKAKAHKAAGRLQAALYDLTEALRIAPQHREVHKVILKIKEEIHTQTSSSNNSSTDASTPRADNHLGVDTKLLGRGGSVGQEGDSSTSGVDSTGSSNCKDFDQDQMMSPNTMVI